MTAGVPWVAEEGNVVGARNQGVHTRRERHRPLRRRGRVLRSVQGPGFVASLIRGTRGGASTPGKPAPQEEPGSGHFAWTNAGSPRAYGDSSGSLHRRVRNETEVAASFSCARTRRARGLARTSYAVAEVVRRRLVPNKVACQPSEKRRGATERGPSAEPSPTVREDRGRRSRVNGAS